MLRKFGKKGGAMTTAIRQTDDQVKEAMSGEKIELCQKCKNQYILIWLKQGEDYNDFGFRHCPFCGLVTEEFCLPAIE
jgi:DNA-directed RNA polymerase subunit M/transcription elongation factor TFIIS